MSAIGLFDEAKRRLLAEPKQWLVTGVAGFIGSNLLEALLKLDQHVVGLDNFATGNLKNLTDVRGAVANEAWARFVFVEGDICDPAICEQAMRGADIVLHQAALGSVPRSIANPQSTNQTNISGFLNMLVAAKDLGVKSFVYAASSSTYGDHPALPKVEERIGAPLSPYAVTKYVNELYASVFLQTYGMRATGMRYFNVFGPRQSPDGAYAAVIPRWIGSMLRGDEITIFGDGETSRDFSYVENVIQANILAALAEGEAAGQVYNVAVGGRSTLNLLFQSLRQALAEQGVVYEREPTYGDFRAGDVRHSQASIEKAIALLGYRPTHDFLEGLRETVPWYVASAAKGDAGSAL